VIVSFLSLLVIGLGADRPGGGGAEFEKVNPRTLRAGCGFQLVLGEVRYERPVAASTVSASPAVTCNPSGRIVTSGM
jgi:hypothetical protein